MILYFIDIITLLLSCREKTVYIQLFQLIFADAKYITEKHRKRESDKRVEQERNVEDRRKEKET